MPGSGQAWVNSFESHVVLDGSLGPALASGNILCHIISQTLVSFDFVSSLRSSSISFKDRSRLPFCQVWDRLPFCKSCFGIK